MINNINVVENKSGGYPRWVDYTDDNNKNSIRVDNETEKMKVLQEIFEIKKLQEKTKTISDTTKVIQRIIYKKR